MRQPYLTSTLLALCLLLSTCASAQNFLTGRVIDSLTNEPIPFATVYLDGTSIGEITGDDGVFNLSGVRLPARLVVSHLAYKTVYLDPTAYGEMGDIIVGPSEAVIQGVEVTDGNLRGKTLAEFTRLLLGNDQWTAEASLLNDEVIEFDRDYAEKTISVSNDKLRERLKKRNRPGARWNEDETIYTYGRAENLKAKTRSILKIRLPHLGYTLSMDLNSFLSDYSTGYTSYLGTFYFAADKKVTSRHRTNRNRAYYGSGMHFARSLLGDSMEANGFKVYAITKGKEGTREQTSEIDLTKYLVKQEDGVNYLVGLDDREFAILYYADNRYRPLPTNKWRRAKPVQSRLFVRANKCLILSSGVFGDTNLVFNGNIGARSIAWALPADFVLEEE
jgi:hypothetical protein